MRGKRRTSGAAIGRTAKRVTQCAACGCVQLKVTDKVCAYCKGTVMLRFDSKGEFSRWGELLMSQRAGFVSGLKRQVPFDLMAARSIDGQIVAVKVGKYVADFVYQKDGRQVVEDHKAGVVEPMARLKLEWMAAMGIEVVLT